MASGSDGTDTRSDEGVCLCVCVFMERETVCVLVFGEGIYSVCVCVSVCLTRHRAAQDLQSHAQTAIPALWDHPDVARQHGHSKLVQHRSVLVTVPKEQLHVQGERDRERGGGVDWSSMIGAV